MSKIKLWYYRNFKVISNEQEQSEKYQFTKEDMWEVFIRGMGAVKHEEVGTISGKEIFDNYINSISRK